MASVFYYKSPAVRPPDVRARTHRRAVIARASLYEQGGRQPGLRIQAAMAGAAKQRSHRLLYMVAQSANYVYPFTLKVPRCDGRMGVLARTDEPS